MEISEVLFNELAFFKLMQNLDNNSSPAAKHKTQRRDERSSRGKVNGKDNANNGMDKAVGTDYSDEDKDYDEAEQEVKLAAYGKERYLQTELNNHQQRSSEASEAEEETASVPLSISLSKAETQALTNYGSGEDENEEEVEEFAAGPVDVQTSLQVTAAGHPEPERMTPTKTLEANTEESQPTPEPHNAEVHSGSAAESGDEPVPEDVRDHEGESPSGNAAASEETTTVPLCQNMLKGPASISSPDTDSPVMINVDEVGSGNMSQKSDEEDFVKVDDLPLQLTVMCEEELQKRIVEEQQNNNLSVEILNGNSEAQSGLVGNAQALKEPEAVGAACEER